MRQSMDELIAAGQRYESYQQAKTDARLKNTNEERERLAKVHKKLFTAPSERLFAGRDTQKIEKRVAHAVLPDEVKPTAGPIESTAAVDPTSIGLEVSFRENDLRPIRYLQLAMMAARSVGKITVRSSDPEEDGDATGFLVAPGLLLTNWHVLKSEEHAAASFVTFNFEDDVNGRPKSPKLFELLPDELFVADPVLDYALVAVTGRNQNGDALSEFGYLRLYEQTGKLDPNRRQAANIVQHPQGQPKRIALRDNYFEEVPKDSIDNARRQNSLFYGTDTLKGSSGAPVCSDEWFVVALHRGGVPKTKNINGKLVVMRLDDTPAAKGDPSSAIHYLANEGTRISRIYGSLREKANGNDPEKAHAAKALHQISAVSKDPRLGPFDISTLPLVEPVTVAAEDGGLQEKLLRRKAELFDGATGYDPDFLDATFNIPLPEMDSEVLREIAPLKTGQKDWLHYDHFSIAMHAQRRTPIVAACNVDGSFLWQTAIGGSRPKRPQWTLDPRLDEVFQPDDAIFSVAMQRGHLYKREDVWSDDADSFDRADKHSFTITNATPMIANFNNKEWGDLEDLITRHLEEGGRVTYFAGPIFDIEDRYFNQLKKGVLASQRKKGMRVPSSFWKIVAWVEDDELKAAGFVLHQSDEIKAHGPITEEIDFGAYKQTLISDIHTRTGLRFPTLEAVDTFE